MPLTPVPVSQFPVATLPLDGDEEVPLVQDGITKRTPSSSFAVFGGALVPEATIAPPAGTFNDVDTLGALHLFVDTTAGDVTITGFEAPAVAGTPLLVTNSGTNLLLLPTGPGSIPANQLYGLPDMGVPSLGSQMLYYSSTVSKWVLA